MIVIKDQLDGLYPLLGKKPSYKRYIMPERRYVVVIIPYHFTLFVMGYVVWPADELYHLAFGLTFGDYRCIDSKVQLFFRTGTKVQDKKADN